MGTERQTALNRGTHARARHGRCTVTTRSGRPCEAQAAVGGVCLRHGIRSRQPHTLTAVGAQLYIFPHGERNLRRGKNRSLIGFAAVELVRRGVIVRAMFTEQGGRRILRRIAAAGVTVVPEIETRGLRVYRLERSSASTSARTSASESSERERAGACGATRRGPSRSGCSGRTDGPGSGDKRREAAPKAKAQ